MFIGFPESVCATAATQCGKQMWTDCGEQSLKSGCGHGVQCVDDKEPFYLFEISHQIGNVERGLAKTFQGFPRGV
jgi:hypothetical protein